MPLALLTVVSLRLPQPPPATFQAQPPRYGRVVGITATAPAILWDDASESVITVALATDLNVVLDVIENADAASISAFLGKVVLRISPNGPATGDPAGGTSREFAGTVVAIYRRTPIIDAAGTGPVFLVVCSQGEFYEDVATNFTVLTNR
jgi:hypothetical protein